MSANDPEGTSLCAPLNVSFQGARSQPLKQSARTFRIEPSQKPRRRTIALWANALKDNSRDQGRYVRMPRRKVGKKQK
jgi:hypothetical protein